MNARRRHLPLLLVLALAAQGTLLGQADSGLAGRRADLAQFRQSVFPREQSYTAETRAEAERRLARLETELAGMSAPRFELELARIVALADNGHSGLQAGSRSRRYNRVPLRLSPFGEEFHVVRAAAAHADLLGARLVAIDGRPVPELRTVARSLAGGTDAWRDRNAAYFYESPDQLHALSMASSPREANYRFALASGQTVDRRLVAEPPAADRDPATPGRALFPDASLRADWRALLPADRAPWALQDPTSVFRWRLAPELNGMVIELRQTRDAPSQPIREFLAAMTQQIREHQPRHLVLDMRMNGGGDLNTARDFMRSLPGLIPGRIFVLTSPWTFSAAISSVGYLEQAAPDKVTIVGEMVGDRLEFWAEGSGATLARTGISVGFSTERHDYQNGCRMFRDCHGPVVRNPISVPTLAPDLAAPWTIEAYRAGRDPGMDAVIAAVRSTQP